MWEYIKEYAKPIGIVVLGVLGAKAIETGATKIVVGAKNQLGKLSLGQSTKSQAEIQAAPQPPASAASGAPQPANASEVNK
jgi:hypothetical protein